MAMYYEEALNLLEKKGQAHVLRFYQELSPEQRNALLEQIEGINFDDVATMQSLLKQDNPEDVEGESFVPADVITLSESDHVETIVAGEDALKSGRVGVILVAGGQGSRLGFDGPKGSFPVGPITHASLFEIHARKILALEHKYGGEVPFYIMTSRTNDASTREFFAKNEFFGLDESRVHFFVQGMWPALDEGGLLVMDRPDHIFLSPDGHGGTLTALHTCGMLKDMHARGVETLFYFQVDNPLVDIAAPAFIGAHRQKHAQVSVKVCAKRNAAEGLGVVVRTGDRNAIVEYTDPRLTDAMKKEVGPDGNLKYRFGSVAIHVFSLEFLDQEAQSQLPLHLAHKKVPFCDAGGNIVTPTSPNAIKFEKFIFDAIPDAERSLNLEFLRADEFSPVKNAKGEDSPRTAQRDMMEKWARWFEVCGIDLPRDEAEQLAVKIEIDPCFALHADDLRRKLPSDFVVEGEILLK